MAPARGAGRLNLLPALEVKHEYKRLPAEVLCRTRAPGRRPGTHHAISTTPNRSTRNPARLGACDWYRTVQMNLDADLVKAAEDVANSETNWPNQI